MNLETSSAEAFDRLAELYREKLMDLTQYDDSYQTFCDLLPRPKANVLDVACGPGNVARFLPNYRPDLQVLGVDLAPRLIELARAAVPGARFMHFDVRQLRRLVVTEYGPPNRQLGDAPRGMINPTIQLPDSSSRVVYAT
jgi:ubiquinone/menaquinone biosynthesis C-methylase UbiE